MRSELTEIVGNELRKAVRASNSNFHHGCLDHRRQLTKNDVPGSIYARW